MKVKVNSCIVEFDIRMHNAILCDRFNKKASQSSVWEPEIDGNSHGCITFHLCRNFKFQSPFTYTLLLQLHNNPVRYHSPHFAGGKIAGPRRPSNVTQARLEVEQGRVNSLLEETPLPLFQTPLLFLLVLYTVSSEHCMLLRSLSHHLKLLKVHPLEGI